MKSGNYTILDLLEDRDLEQFVIPEIQRDYVWQSSDVTDFLTYLKDGFEGTQEDVPYLGFIYAYTDRDFVNKYYLIDGQQRMTTLYLLLLTCYQLSGKTLPSFLFHNQYLKIDYRVRQATHDLFIDLVLLCQNNPGIKNLNIEDQVWFHKDYMNDRTIQNLIGNFKIIRQWLIDLNIGLIEFAKYVEDKVMLSYYDIDEGRQGEELYIYMNSRGRQLEPNETLKARYLAGENDKNTAGIKWESWQDFFWKHKGNRPDADTGFNDFLRMVQVIHMTGTDYASDIIIQFANGRSSQDPLFENLPKSQGHLEAYFTAFQWMVNNEKVSAFFLKHESLNYITTAPRPDRRLVFLFRILPIINFISVSGCRDEKIILRFVRFFYNVSRKSQTIGKDISAQLLTAIRFMSTYAQTSRSEFDVCDLLDYSKGRAILIDAGEISKLTIIKAAKDEMERTRLEEVFAEAEDHKIFEGDISFLVNRCYDTEKSSFDINLFEKLWKIFAELFKKDRSNYAPVTIALLHYGYTWTIDTPYYYENYNCQNWFSLVRDENGQHLMQLLEDLCDQPNGYIDLLIKQKTKQYFLKEGFVNVQALKNVTVLFEQVKILAALDYHTQRKMFNNAAYIAKDDRFNYGDIPFFQNSPELFNVYRYVDAGRYGRLMKVLEDLLIHDSDVKATIDKIIS